MPQKKSFQELRREATEASIRLERARRDLKSREEAVPKVIARLREACPHADAVELRYEWTEGETWNRKYRAAARRYCLGCGLDEAATAYHVGEGRHAYRYRRLEKARIVREELARESGPFTDLLAIFRERLHDLARFDEFDACGVWHGEKKGDDANLVRGSD